MADIYFMGLDYGTQGVRCGIADQNGKFAAVHETKYKTEYPAPGRAVQSPSDWIDATLRVIDDCYITAGREVFAEIKAICVCTTSSTVIPVDKEGNALDDAILWMDMRAAEQAERINGTGHKVLKYSGGEDSAEWIVPKMMWLKENEPELFKKADRLVEQQDFINCYLTGNMSASMCQATCKSNYVDSEGGFSKDFFETIGFNEFFDKADLEVLEPGTLVGMIRPEIADKFHLNNNVEVYQGEIDAYANMLGLGVCEAGRAGIVMGSSFVHMALTEDQEFLQGVWGPYKDALVPGLYVLEGGQTSAASVTKWFLDVFDIKGKNPYGEMADEASEVPPGSNGLIAIDYFQGCRTPHKDPLAKGVIYGLTLSHTRADIYRCLLEGVAYGTKSVLDALESESLTIAQIRGCGGVVKNPLWLSIIADVTGKTIVLTQNSDNAGVLGCCAIAAAGYGTYANIPQACEHMVKVTKEIRPDEQNRKLYEKFYKKYTEIFNALQPIMDEAKNNGKEKPPINSDIRSFGTSTAIDAYRDIRD